MPTPTPDTATVSEPTASIPTDYDYIKRRFKMLLARGIHKNPQADYFDVLDDILADLIRRVYPIPSTPPPAPKPEKAGEAESPNPGAGTVGEGTTANTIKSETTNVEHPEDVPQGQCLEPSREMGGPSRVVLPTESTGGGAGSKDQGEQAADVRLGDGVPSRKRCAIGPTCKCGHFADYHTERGCRCCECVTYCPSLNKDFIPPGMVQPNTAWGDSDHNFTAQDIYKRDMQWRAYIFSLSPKEPPKPAAREWEPNPPGVESVMPWPNQRGDVVGRRVSIRSKKYGATRRGVITKIGMERIGEYFWMDFGVGYFFADFDLLSIDPPLPESVKPASIDTPHKRDYISPGIELTTASEPAKGDPMCKCGHPKSYHSIRHDPGHSTEGLLLCAEYGMDEGCRCSVFEQVLVPGDFKVDGEIFRATNMTLSGAEIKRIAHVLPEWSMYDEGGDADRPDTQISDTQIVRFDRPRKFYTVPPATWSGSSTQPEPAKGETDWPNHSTSSNSSTPLDGWTEERLDALTNMCRSSAGPLNNHSADAITALRKRAVAHDENKGPQTKGTA
jgi:hypothetical protein